MNTTDDLIHAIIKYGIFKVSMNPDTRVLKFEEFDASEVSIQLGEIESEKAYDRLMDAKSKGITVEDDGSTEVEVDEEMKKFIAALKWETILFSDISKITIRNEEPEAERDSERTYDEPLVFERDAPAGVTVRDIVEGVWCVKAQKNNYWNELYCGIDKKEIKDNNMTLTIGFDYGS